MNLISRGAGCVCVAGAGAGRGSCSPQTEVLWRILSDLSGEERRRFCALPSWGQSRAPQGSPWCGHWGCSPQAPLPWPSAPPCALPPPSFNPLQGRAGLQWGAGALLSHLLELQAVSPAPGRSLSSGTFLGKGGQVPWPLHTQGWGEDEDAFRWSYSPRAGFGGCSRSREGSLGKPGAHS